jgi:hypothetical protein
LSSRFLFAALLSSEKRTKRSLKEFARSIIALVSVTAT